MYKLGHVLHSYYHNMFNDYSLITDGQHFTFYQIIRTIDYEWNDDCNVILQCVLCFFFRMCIRF